MTKLEYAIMESERHGEIDLETRDTLLNILEAEECGENTGTDELTMESVDELRLRVYEAFEDGKITEPEKSAFLEYLNPENYD